AHVRRVHARRTSTPTGSTTSPTPCISSSGCSSEVHRSHRPIPPAAGQEDPEALIVPKGQLSPAGEPRLRSDALSCRSAFRARLRPRRRRGLDPPPVTMPELSASPSVHSTGAHASLRLRYSPRLPGLRLEAPRGAVAPHHRAPLQPAGRR